MTDIDAIEDPATDNGLGMPLRVGAGLSLGSITQGAQRKPCKMVLYGVQGIGKTTFAAASPNPIFLPIEDGLASIEAPRFPRPDSFAAVLEAMRVLYREKHDYRTLVVDTLDALEPLIWRHVCDDARKKSIEDFGYGKGYVHAVEEWRRFLGACEVLRDKVGMGIILIAHSAVVRTSPPDGEEYDRYSLKLHKMASAAVQEWADAVLFAQYEVRVIKTESPNGKSRARAVGDGSRVLRTSERPAWAAKNRFNLPDDLPLEWPAFVEAMKGPTP